MAHGWGGCGGTSVLRRENFYHLFVIINPVIVCPITRFISNSTDARNVYNPKPSGKAFQGLGACVLPSEERYIALCQSGDALQCINDVLIRYS